jgi:hypothetical protein
MKERMKKRANDTIKDIIKDIIKESTTDVYDHGKSDFLISIYVP